MFPWFSGIFNERRFCAYSSRFFKVTKEEIEALNRELSARDFGCIQRCSISARKNLSKRELTWRQRYFEQLNAIAEKRYPTNKY
jgi:hypothetical protein